MLGDGLRLLVSTDGLRWSALPRVAPVLPLSRVEGAKVFRDPSMVWHAGYFHLVFTSDLCVDQAPGKWVCRRHGKKVRPTARFGYARSRDLLVWEGVRLVEAPVKHACSLWAPELLVLPAGPAAPPPLSRRLHRHERRSLCPQSMRDSIPPLLHADAWRALWTAERAGVDGAAPDGRRRWQLDH